MPIYETFAKRKQREENAGKPVIYRYDVLPAPFRVQVAHIWWGAIGGTEGLLPNSILNKKELWWQGIHNTLAREMGVFSLAPVMGVQGPFMGRCEKFLLENDDVDQVLSIIEISFELIDNKVREFVIQELHRSGIDALHTMGISQLPDDAIQELNHRFQEHTIGYQYLGGQIVRSDSQYLHSEVVEPAVSLLYDARFEGALQEFMNAHKHYRERNNKEAISAASNAFESTLKTICERRQWNPPPPYNASKLLGVLFANNLIPAAMKSYFDSLSDTLRSGVPTIRNAYAAHGQGSKVVEVPDHLAAYALHLTASSIVFLINSYNSNQGEA